MKTYRILLFTWLVMLAGASSFFDVEASEPAFEGVIARLQKDGFTKEEIHKLYQHPDAEFNIQGVSAFFRHSEGRLNYDQFLSLINIAKARRYMADHQSILLEAQRQYEVTPEVITAILLVETRLGTYLGRSKVFNILSTMASLQDTSAREKLWREMSSERRYDRRRFNEKANQRSPWAYNELKAYIHYTQGSGLDPLQVQGSYAGAMGICQFMPSNIEGYGADGNGDGRIDLFDHSDAIFSVARYFQKHGWKPGLKGNDAIAVVKRYNNSNSYAKTILGVAQKLKK